MVYLSVHATRQCSVYKAHIFFSKLGKELLLRQNMIKQVVAQTSHITKCAESETNKQPLFIEHCTTHDICGKEKKKKKNRASVSWFSYQTSGCNLVGHQAVEALLRLGHQLYPLNSFSAQDRP